MVAQIWSYPESSTLGFTLFSIPLEEVFFFFIQTYITSCLYALIMRPVIGALQLPRTPKLAQQAVQRRATGSAVLLATAAYCAAQIPKGGPWTYMCLIIAWCAPFFAIIWCVSSASNRSQMIDTALEIAGASLHRTSLR